MSQVDKPQESLAAAPTPETDAVIRIADNYGAYPPGASAGEGDGVTADEAHYEMCGSLEILARSLERRLQHALQEFDDLAKDFTTLAAERDTAVGREAELRAALKRIIDLDSNALRDSSALLKRIEALEARLNEVESALLYCGIKGRESRA